MGDGSSNGNGERKLPNPTTLVQAAYALEPLPPSLARLAALVADEATQLRQIVEVVTLDPAMTGALLRRANAASSAPRRAIATVQEAVVRLGMGLVLSLSVCSHLSRLSRSTPTSTLGAELWRHSVAAAIAGDVVRGQARVDVPPETSTAALLHDIGRLVADRFLPADVLTFVRQSRRLSGRNRLQAEVGALGVHHAELGGLIAEHWGLPESLVNGIRHHHTPEEARTPIAYATSLSNMLAHDVAPDEDAKDHASEAPVEDPDAAKRLLAALGMNADGYPELRALVADRYEKTRGRFS